jgi:hypothetical protein
MRMGGFSSAFAYARDLIDALNGTVGGGIFAWLLAGVFALSGGLKLRRPILAAMAITDFGVSRRVRPVLGRLLGIGELAVAVTLVVSPRVGGVFAAILLWFFVALIARSLRAGRKFACVCFGERDSAISRWTLVRTCLLAILATALAIAAPNLGATGANALLQAEIAGGVLGFVALIRSVPRLLRWNSDPFSEHQQEVPA